MDIYYKSISESGKQMINYVCKYAPVELFKGFGQECAVLEEMPENFDKSDKIAHANLCGFGKSVIQAVLEGKVEELVLVNCCDSMRRVYDIIENTGKCKFLYMLDLPHEDNECENIKFAQSILRLKKAYERYSHRTFDRELFIKSFAKPESERKPYIGLMGVHVSSILEKTICENMQMDVENMTCTSGRNLIILQKDLRNMDDETLFLAYAESLLGQMPCARMNNNTRRNQLFLDPSLKGIIYHTIKFCDYYGFEYASIKNNIKVPLLKLETDFTSQSAGQLLTRIQAFAETIEGSDDMDPTKGISEEARRRMESYWVNTSENSILRNALEVQGRSFEKEYETLVTEGEVEVTVDFSMAYYEKMDEANLWGLLVNAGIVTITKEIEEDYYRLRVPNLEVWKVFKELTACHLQIDERQMEKMLNALKRKDMERFAEEYQRVLLELPSYHDLKDENSYHMMTLGMCTFLRKDYDIKSNRETGEGRSDICLYAKHDRYPNLILEFKYTKDEKDDLEKLAEKALEQIKEKQYDAEMTGEVCYVGLAHCGKRVTVHSRVNHSAD